MTPDWNTSTIHLMGHTTLRGVRWRSSTIIGGGIETEDGTHYGPGAVYQIEPSTPPTPGAPVWAWEVRGHGEALTCDGEVVALAVQPSTEARALLERRYGCRLTPGTIAVSLSDPNVSLADVARACGDHPVAAAYIIALVDSLMEGIEGDVQHVSKDADVDLVRAHYWSHTLSGILTLSVVDVSVDVPF